MLIYCRGFTSLIHELKFISNIGPQKAFKLSQACSSQNRQVAYNNLFMCAPTLQFLTYSWLQLTVDRSVGWGKMSDLGCPLNVRGICSAVVSYHPWNKQGLDAVHMYKRRHNAKVLHLKSCVLQKLHK